MSERDQELPFKPLGVQLRRLRVQQQETLADASGAVEIEVDQLVEIEKGSKRPSEDVLMLLITHFATKEDEADRLWRLAGYSRDDSLPESIDDEEIKILSMAQNSPIAYTDAVHVVTNDYGLVMNFLQSNGRYNKPQIAARVGMSKEYATHLSEILRRALEQESPLPKALPWSSNQPSNNKDKTK